MRGELFGFDLQRLRPVRNNIQMNGCGPGSLQVQTVPGASCSLLVQLNSGTFGDAPPKLMATTAGPDGSVVWSYPAALVPSGHGRHTVVCTDGSRSSEVVSEFDIAARTRPRRATSGT